MEILVLGAGVETGDLEMSLYLGQADATPKTRGGECFGAPESHDERVNAKRPTRIQIGNCASPLADSRSRPFTPTHPPTISVSHRGRDSSNNNFKFKMKSVACKNEQMP